MNKPNEIIKKKKTKKGKILTNQHQNLKKKKTHRHCGVRYSRLSVLRIEFQIFFYLFLDCKFSDFNDVLGLAQKTLSRLVFGNHFGPNIVGQNNQKKKKIVNFVLYYRDQDCDCTQSYLFPPPI